MKIIIAALTAAFFAAAAVAGDSYLTFGEGNPDLAPQWGSMETFTGVQPSVGDEIQPYHGFAEGNPDVCKCERIETGVCEDPNIYANCAGNPDLAY
jgi:hypothetical protein